MLRKVDGTAETASLCCVFSFEQDLNILFVTLINSYVDFGLDFFYYLFCCRFCAQILFMFICILFCLVQVFIVIKFLTCLLFTQSSVSANEDIGSYSAADSSYFNQSSSTAAGGTGTATTAASSGGAKQDDKSNKDNSKSAAAAAARAQAASGGSSWIGGFFSKFKPKTQMKLPDDKNPTVFIILLLLFINVLKIQLLNLCFVI